MKRLDLTTEIINKIKESAHKRFITDTVDSRERDNFLASCFIKATLDFLETSKMLEYDAKDKTHHYETVDE